MAQTNVVSLRLDTTTTQFIESVKGELKPGEAIKKILKYLQQFELAYTQDIMKAEIP